jgi:hypothetical protein
MTVQTVKLVNLLKEGYFKKWVTVQTVKLVNLLKEGYFNEWVTVQTVKLVNLLKEGYFPCQNVLSILFLWRFHLWSDLIWTSSLNEHVVLLFLLLPNTDHLQQVEDYVRGCSISTKFWPSSTSLWLCQKLFYFVQPLTPSPTCWRRSVFGRSRTTSDIIFNFLKTVSIWILTTFNKLKIMSEVILLLPNTDRLKQVEDYVRGCSISAKYWQPSTSWKLCKRLFYFCQILTALNKLKNM